MAPPTFPSSAEQLVKLLSVIVETVELGPSMNIAPPGTSDEKLHEEKLVKVQLRIEDPLS
jgi:hypothetical protein